MNGLGAHFDAESAKIKAPLTKYLAAYSRKLSAQYIFNAKLDKV
tara:strand:- start:279 stop:410 length:132 start_codon:yes stop_codon:yes gene_type:complete